MFIEPARHFQRIIAVPLHAQRECFYAREYLKSIERRDGRAEIAQSEYSRSNRKGNISKGFVNFEARIIRTWFGQKWVIPGFSPIKCTCIHQYTTHGVTMTANKFGERMYNNICAVLDWAYQIWRGHSIIDDERKAMIMHNI